MAVAAASLHAILLCHLRARLSGLRRTFYWALAAATLIAFTAWASRPQSFGPPGEEDDAALHAAIERDLLEIHRANVAYAVDQKLPDGALLPDLDQMVLTGYLRGPLAPPGRYAPISEYRQAREWGGPSPAKRTQRPGMAERAVITRPGPAPTIPSTSPSQGGEPEPAPTPEAVIQMSPSKW